MTFSSTVEDHGASLVLKSKPPLAHGQQMTVSSTLFWCSLILSLLFGHTFHFTALHPFDTIVSSTSHPADLSSDPSLLRAWTLVTDLSSYPTWNTFTTSVTSTTTPPVVGQPVQLSVSLGPPFPLSLVSNTTSSLVLDFTWKEYNSQQHKMCWGIQNTAYPVLDLILSSHRCCELRFQPRIGVQVQHSDKNIGYLAPLVSLLYKNTIEQGFQQMTIDMRNRLALGDTSNWEEEQGEGKLRIYPHIRGRNKDYVYTRWLFIE